METLKRMPFKAKKSVFDELEKIVDIAALSKEERMKYDESIKVYRDNLAIASGQRKLGIEEVARNLKSLGMAPELIQKASGLSIEEINNL